jgi:polysaccharide deacetylase 2 family uncharacterized protein YibQ
LIGGATALVIIGIFGGVALDLALRPIPTVSSKSGPRPAPRPAPVVRNTVPDEPQAAPSIFDSRTDVPQRPAEQPRAEPEVSPPPPRMAPSGTAPLTAFAVAVQIPRARPVLAIVIDDMGLDRTGALKAIALRGPLTLSMMTYAPDLRGLAKQAHEAGHEVMAHVPMEPLDRKENPGPHALTVAMNDAAIRATLATDLDPWQGYVGINNHMGSRFTKDPERMAVVMEELKARGLMWLDSKTTVGSAGTAAAREAGVPFIERDFFLDNTQTFAAIREEFEKAVATAKSRGSAVAIGHPHEATVNALKQLLPTLDERGVSLAPVTEVLKRRQPSR